MPLTLSAVTTRELCKELKPYFGGLSSLPYNRYNSDNTVWWLSPGPQVPAYRYPKFAVMPPEPDAPEQLFIGIYIEKGVSDAYARAVGYSKHHVLDKDWAWHGLMADMASGEKLSRSFSEISAATGVTPELRLYATMQVKEAADNLAPKGERIIFDISGNKLAVQQPIQSPLLQSLATCSTLSELASSVEHLDKSSFIWIDLVAGLPVELVNGQGQVTAEYLAKKVLSSLEWVVEI